MIPRSGSTNATLYRASSPISWGMLASDATIDAMTAKYGAAVGSSIAAIDAPVTNAEPPPALRPGSSRRARLCSRASGPVPAGR